MLIAVPGSQLGQLNYLYLKLIPQYWDLNKFRNLNNYLGTTWTAP
jgi:hypothetical protein